MFQWLVNETDVRTRPVAAEFQGRLRWTTPAVDATAPLAVHAALLDAEGTVLHDYTLKLQLRPRVDRALLADRRVAILGRENGDAWRLAEFFGASPVPWSATAADTADLVIADSADAALGAADSLTPSFLAQGGKIFF